MNNQETLTKRILKGSFVVIFFALLSSPIGYLLRMLYSQALSIEMFGLFYAVTAFFSIIATYNDLGFGYSTSYFLPKFLKEKDYQKCWKLYKYDQIIEVGTSLLISLILILLAPWLANNFFRVPSATSIIYIFCVYLIASSFLSAQNKFFTGLQQEKYYSSMLFVRLFLTLLFSVFYWLFDLPNIIFFAIALAVSTIIVTLIYNYFLYKNNRIIPNRPLNWDKQLFTLMKGYAVPSLMTTSIFSFIVFSDTFFLTLFKGVKEVGIYNIVLPLVSISSIFLSPINALLFPLVSHLMVDERNKVSLLLETILKIIPFIGLYFALFIVMFPQTPVLLLFGAKWLGLVETSLTILALGFIISSLSSFLTTIIAGLGKVNERLRVSVIIAIASVILNGLLVYQYGVVGAVISNSLIYILSVYLFGKIIKSTIVFQYPVKYYLKLGAFSVIFYIAVKGGGILPITWAQYIWCGSVYTIIMILFAYRLQLFDKDMIKLIIKETETAGVKQTVSVFKSFLQIMDRSPDV